ncbi:MAG: hypothetical protein HQL23_07775 [Candidatus Omnitrophica bacterium]|nr:hypothetical protein [Candidatus Omnitrophota bacterium]
MAVVGRIMDLLRDFLFPSRPRRRAKGSSRKKKARSNLAQPKKLPVPVKVVPAAKKPRAPKKAAEPKIVPAAPIRKNFKPQGTPVGEITHFFPKIKVVVVKMTAGRLRVGDRVAIQGQGKGFVQSVTSLQVESLDVAAVNRGQTAGMKVVRPAKAGDQLIRLT